MGTSLSGLTPATTFDGLLKTSDNEPLDGTLKAISTGDGTDTILSLSNSALKISGDTEIDSSGLNALIVKRNGTELLKSDGSGLNGGIIFTGNLGNLFSVGVKGNDFNIWDGSYLGGGDLRFSILADGKTGIGAQTPTAQLHIKGSGASAGTTSLLVQNSAGDDMLKVTDNGKVGIGGVASPSQSLHINGNIRVNDANGIIYSNKFAGLSAGDLSISTSGNTLLAQTGNVGIGETTPTARLHLKGSGNDNTTTSLLVQNSDGIPALSVSDDRHVLVGDGSAQGYDANLTFIRASGGARGANLRQVSADLILTNAFGGFKVNGIQTTLKGSGATSATTALLVENSAGTDLLKVDDDGDVSIPGKAYFAGFGTIIDGNKIYTSNTGNGFIQLTSNNLEYSDTGTNGKDESAALTLTSTTRGFLPPRMTTTQRDAINMVGDPAVSTPAAGLIIYNTDTNTAECYNGTAWIPMF